MGVLHCSFYFSKRIVDFFEIVERDGTRPTLLITETLVSG